MTTRFHVIASSPETGADNYAEFDTRAEAQAYADAMIGEAICEESWIGGKPVLGAIIGVIDHAWVEELPA